MRKLLTTLLLTILVKNTLLAFSLLNYNIPSLEQVNITFDTPLTITTATTIVDEDGISHAYTLDSDLTTIIVQYDNPIQQGKYHSLTITALRSTTGGTYNGGISFYMPQHNDVIINEIMHDINPIVNLPAAKYIEIYNQSPYSIPLDGWTISTGEYTYNLPSITISSHQYQLICAVNDTLALAFYATLLPISTLQHLLVAGTSLTLRHSSSLIVDYVQYTNTWHTSNYKKQGGWSLERIDPTNPTPQGNWTSSNNSNGGTPGTINSVFQFNPDTIQPYIYAISIPSPDTILIHTNKQIHPATINSNNFILQYHDIQNIVLQEPSQNNIALILSTSLQPDDVDTLMVTDLEDITRHSYISSIHHIAYPESITQYNDIIINEILTNPVATSAKYIEIYNPTNHTWNLSTINLANIDTITSQPQQPHSITQQPIILAPNNYCTITPSVTSISQHHTLPENPQILNATLPTLPADRGAVALITSSAFIIDQLCYTPRHHHPLLRNSTAVALERINPELPSDDINTWQSASSQVHYATPCRQNSQYQDIHSNITESSRPFTLQNKNFSPDANGYNDLLVINYALPIDGYTLNVDIYTATGQHVHRLCNNTLLSTSGSILWNGTTTEGTLCQPGIYILRIEYQHPTGKRAHQQLICSLTTL